MASHSFGERESVLEADVLVIGGGAAGCMAALAAAQQGRSVLIVEKSGSISRSGNLASGIDHFLAVLNEEPWDTPEQFLENLVMANEGLIDLKVAEAFAYQVKDRVEQLEAIGVPLREATTGRFRRVAGLGGRQPWWINFEGGDIKPILARRVRSSPIRIVEKVMVVDLLVKDGTVEGAAGFHIRDGDFYIFKAKATVIATGGAVRHYPTASGPLFRTHHCPFNTGDGYAMGYRAGAELTNMEFTYCSVVPKGFSSPGITGFIGLGAVLRNALGEAYMNKYHPWGNNAPRNAIVQGTLEELRAGRGPCYVDCTHLSPEAIRYVEAGIRNEKFLLLDYLRAQGVDLSKQWLEIELQELDQGVTFAAGTGNGLIIDADCACTLNGLYACGDSAHVSFAAAGAVTYGFRAGLMAARYATKRNSPVSLEKAQIQQMKGKVYAPLARRTGISWRDVQVRLQQIMQDHAGLVRTKTSLQVARDALKDLERELERICTEDYHGLMRVHEIGNLRQVAELLVTAALFREESRLVPAHFRSDFPTRNDPMWLGYVVLRRKGDETLVSFRKLGSNKHSCNAVR